jgi:hypothetical protein
MAYVGEDRSIAGLVTELTRETTTLFRKEVQLARAEVAQKLSQIGSGLTAAAAGGLIAFVGLQALVAAAILGLALTMDWWLAALIVGVAVLVIGLIVLMIGLNRLKAERLAPKRTINTLRDNTNWAREQLR